MDSREVLLNRLEETTFQLLDFYRRIPDPHQMVYELWSARDVLAHLTFWHESFARNVTDLANGRTPSPLKGRFIDLNPAGVASMSSESLDSIIKRFEQAQEKIRENILNPSLIMIPYKIGSRQYSPEEHLSVVEGHIRKHLLDVRNRCAPCRGKK